MKTKHTPGPWKVDPDYLEEVICSEFVSILPYCTSGFEEEAEANAKLIAAAPEMLEALKTVDLFLNEVHISHTNESKLSLALVKKVIKKATE